MVIIYINSLKSVAGIFWWTINIVLQTLAVMSLLLLSTISIPLSYIISLLLATVGSICFAIGLELYFTSRFNHYVLFVLGTLEVLLFSLLILSRTPRSILLASISSSFILISIIYLIILHRSTGAQQFGSPKRVLMVLYVLFAGLHGYRLILSLFLYRQGYPLDTGFEHPLLQMTSLLSQLILIVVNFTILILINSSLVQQLKDESAEREQLVQRLRILASTDTLTGLKNRRSSEEQVKRFLQSIDGQKGRTGGLLLIDVDDFKTTNDTWGHDAGDRVLTFISSILSRTVDQSALAGRWGGDEFIIFIPDSSFDQTRAIANTIQSGCSNAHPTVPYPCNVSIGGTSVKENESYSSLFCRADLALYEAKKRGKNMVRWN